MMAGALLIALPLVTLVQLAMSDDGGSLAHVIRTVLPQAAQETALLLLGVAVLTALFGTGAAWLVTAFEFPFRRVLAIALVLPLAVPTYIAAAVYVEWLDAAGPVQRFIRMMAGVPTAAALPLPSIRSLPGAILVMSAVLYPYVYLSTRALFTMQSATLIEAARSLGAKPARVFWRVALPLARPAMALGVSLCLLETLNDIGASEFLGVRTLTLSVMTTWLNRGSLEGAAAIACAMLIMVIALLLVEVRARGERGFSSSVKRPRNVAPKTLMGAEAFGAFCFCALPVIVGFVVPAAFLALQAVQRTLRGQIDPMIVEALLTTIILAGGATLGILLLASGIAAGNRLLGTAIARALARFASLGYAIPGTVLALGLLTPIAFFDNQIANLWRAATGERIGLVLTGSGLAIIIAYHARFLGIAIGAIENGYARISPHLDDAARMLGRSLGGIRRDVHRPLIRPALGTAALLVFVDAMKELPATLLLRPLNVETLATLVYADAARGVFEAGSLAALLIVLIGLGPIMLIARANRPEPADAFLAASAAADERNAQKNPA
ncbi:iron ABC transporter permease [Rhizobiales bacterium TNE-4]|nr:iron ABC transporter permease [Rhizobiales bacterium TNE-4]MBV1827353.1 iron ABC transporter permease [Rhizobiales bacterium TNE-4]